MITENISGKNQKILNNVDIELNSKGFDFPLGFTLETEFQVFCAKYKEQVQRDEFAQLIEMVRKGNTLDALVFLEPRIGTKECLDFARKLIDIIKLFWG